ncbi:MAG: DUF294 nucleotidyltransferase-like domain-containing protein, partial [Burkholderiales bacterium]
MTATTQIPHTLRDAAVDELRRYAPFGAMQREHLRAMVAGLRLGYYTEGSTVIGPHNGVPETLFIVRRGNIEVTLSDAALGTSPDSSVFLPGESFPIGALIALRPVSRIYRAREDSFCWLLPRDGFQRLLKDSPEFHDFCMRGLANLLEQSHARLVAEYASAALAHRSLAQPLSSVIARSAVTCTPDTPLRSALTRMHRERVGSIAVVRDDGFVAGIFTLRDLLDRVASGHADFDAPIERYMTHDPVTVDASAPAVEAAVLMARHGFHHVPVTQSGRLAGVVSEKDLFAKQRAGVTRLADAMRAADDEESLVHIAHDVRELAYTLLAQGTAAEHVCRIVTELNDALAARVIERELALDDLLQVPLVWLALGSEGRGEQTFATDQDNAILFSDSTAPDPETVRSRLLPAAKRINQALDRLGFALCKGGIMAGNARCCLSHAEWRQNFSAWIDRGDPDALLGAAIFFDFRPLWGDAGLAQSLRDWLATAAAGNRRFQRQLAEQALINTPPLGTLRDFRLTEHEGHPGTIDLKLNGTTPFVDAGRILALATGVQSASTSGRLAGAAARLHVDSHESDAWNEAFWFLLLLRLRGQHEQIKLRQA